MISKRINGRRDGKTSAKAALRYGEGLTVGLEREASGIVDKSHRTRFGNFGLVNDGVYAGRGNSEMAEIIELAALEMQSNCDLNARVGSDKKLAHFVVSYNQEKPTEGILRDSEDSMLAAMGLANNHFATFLHNDNGYWHLHIFASRIEKAYPHRGNPLWQDKKKRDKVCREIEIRHGLSRDHGLHEIDAHGQIIEVPLAERKAAREAKPKASDRARAVERYSGEKSFQTWCNDIRIGDRLKHAKSWMDLHAAAAAYNCEIKPKGAGFVVCPLGENGGIPLSKVGLKNLPAKFGLFQPAQKGQAVEVVGTYTPSPTRPAGSLYQEWKTRKDQFKGIKTTALNALRTSHAAARAELRKQQRAELDGIKATMQGEGRSVALSIAKLKHAVSMTELAANHAAERRQTRQEISESGPGSTFRDYLVKQGAIGNDAALALARKYSAGEATDVLREREAERFKVVAAVTGMQDITAPRLTFLHRIERSGTVIFDLGRGRKLIDSVIANQIQLNHAAAVDPATVETSLRFAASKFGNKLVLTGPAEFQKLAVETAVSKGLGVTFIDPALDAYREKLEAEGKTPHFIQPNKAQATKRNYEPNEPRYRSQPPRQIPPAHLRDRLHYLFDGDMVLHIRPDIVPLQQDVRSRMEQSQQEKPDHRMQCTTHGAGQNRRIAPTPSKALQPEAYLTIDAGKDIAQCSAREAKEKAYAAIVASIKQHGGSVFETKEGVSYVGVVKLSTDGRFAIQQQGRGAVVIHDLAKLEGRYIDGQQAHITYRAGIGRDKLQALDHARTRSHGGHAR